MSHQPSPTPDVTKRLCSWIHALCLDDVPEDVKTRAKYSVLDTRWSLFCTSRSSPSLGRESCKGSLYDGTRGELYCVGIQ